MLVELNEKQVELVEGLIREKAKLVAYEDEIDVMKGILENIKDGLFFDYVKAFYGKGGLYELGVNDDQIRKGIEIYKNMVNILDPKAFAGDSVDRERIRQVLEVMVK